MSTNESDAYFRGWNAALASLAAPQAPAPEAGQAADALDARRYRWLAERFLGADFGWNGSDEDNGTPCLLFKVHERTKVWGDLGVTVDVAMQAALDGQEQAK